MKKHKFYMTDEFGGFDGTDRKRVSVDAERCLLNVGKLRIPFGEIVTCELRPFERAKGVYLAIDVCGPAVNNHEPTTIRLLHKNFFCMTNVRAMQDLADELKLAMGNQAVLKRPTCEQQPVTAAFRGRYVLSLSLAIAAYRKAWYDYERRSTVVWKTLMLMVVGGVLNIIGVLLVAVPFDNFKMSRNLTAVGWSNYAASSVYVITTLPAYLIWVYYILKWTLRN